jgi:hypothetical protein
MDQMRENTLSGNSYRMQGVNGVKSRKKAGNCTTNLGFGLAETMDWHRTSRGTGHGGR